MKKILLMVISVIFITFITIFAIIPVEKKYENEAWMKLVDDNTKIFDMSIPGTHDSGATHSFFDVAGKCQDLSIEAQLNIGVRFFDLRLQMVNNEFRIMHSFVNQNLKFVDVLDSLSNYLYENSSEFIIISIKKEADTLDSNKGFEELLLENLGKYRNVSYDKLPNTLKEARGKIFILSRYKNSTIGIPAYDGWKDSTSFELSNMYIQDNYCVEDFSIKKTDILKSIEESNNGNKLVLNFTSCYKDGGFPPSNALKAALEINEWFNEMVKENNKCLGIVIMDFITENTSKNIYKRNIV